MHIANLFLERKKILTLQAMLQRELQKYSLQLEKTFFSNVIKDSLDPELLYKKFFTPKTSAFCK